jgi:hypothetical protein
MRNQIIEIITTVNGKLHHFCLRREWWTKRNANHLYDQVFELTSFLHDTATFRERLFYIQNEWNTKQYCPICRTNSRTFDKNGLKLSVTCSNSTCKSTQKSITTSGVNKNLSEHIKKRKAKKCKLANIGSYEQKFGKVRADILKENQRKRLLGSKQAKETIEKRAAKHRGKILSKQTKLKISLSNKKTHSSKEYIDRRNETHKDVGKKLSLTIKTKILNGTFTPNITNSWTRKNIELDIGGVKIKFRSSWEAAYVILNPTHQYEKIRIPYELNGVIKTYIVDFADFENNILYEIKPTSMKSTDVCLLKENAANKWAAENGWVYKYITDDWFINNLDKLKELKFPYLGLLKKGVLT